jgi:peptide/nickel transport system permease protein
MAAFIVRRLAWMVLVMFAISVLVFAIFFLTPGVDPARQMAGRNPTQQTIASIRSEFGLDKPRPIQYAEMMNHLLISRDLVSYTNRGLPVMPQLRRAAPVTLCLVFGAALIWVVMSVVIGLLAVVLKGSVWDPLIMIVALIGISAPVFWLGQVANMATQSKWHDTFLFSWVPPLGYTPFTTSPTEWFQHLIIPWMVLAIGFAGLYGRVLRADVLAMQNEDFVRTARAKGLTGRRVMFRHVLRNSMITYISLFGLDFAALVGGGVLLTEVVFGLPGIGQLTYQSLSSLDLPVIMATVIYGAFFITLASALVDIGYAYLDPRIRLN